MRDRLKMVAIIALLATGASGAALGQTAGPQTSAYTCPPGYIAQLMQVADELEPFDAGAIDREPNKASIEKLMKLPSFRQAYEFDGMRPDQFAHYGSFKATETEFSAATRQTVDFVRMTLES